MFDNQLLASAIIFSVGMALFIVMIIFLLVDLGDKDFFDKDKGYIITAIIGFVISAISLFFVIKYYRLSNTLEFVHERLLNDLDKAEKELQKFYIDHPQFKEIKEWYLKYTQRLKTNGVYLELYILMFLVLKNFIYDNGETVHYTEGFIDAEKIKIYPLFHVAKIWEKPRVYNKE